jgi:hypothetical protein
MSRKVANKSSLSHLSTSVSSCNINTSQVPSANQCTETTSSVLMTIGSLGSAPVATVDYIVDGVARGRVFSAPYSLQIPINPGNHTVAVRVTYKDGFVIAPAEHTVVVGNDKQQVISVVAVQTSAPPTIPTVVQAKAQAPIPAPFSVTPTFGPFVTSFTRRWDDPALTLTAPTSNSDGTFDFATDSIFGNLSLRGGIYDSDSGLYVVTGNSVVVDSSPGTSTIIVTQAASGIYMSASITVTVTVLGTCELGPVSCNPDPDATHSCMDTPNGGYECECANCHIGADCYTLDPACA